MSIRTVLWRKRHTATCASGGSYQDGRLMAKFPHIDARKESRILGLLALGLAIFGIAAPYAWHDVPSWLPYSAMALAAFCILWAIWDLLPPRVRPWAARLGAGLTGTALISALIGISIAWYREHQRISDRDLMNAYLLIGKSNEIKKTCITGLIPASTELNAITDGLQHSDEYIVTLTHVLSPEIKVITVSKVEPLEPGLSFLVAHLNPGDASYISVEWIK
jgi:hypothetical protein